MAKKIKPTQVINKNKKPKLKHIILTGVTSTVAVVPIATSASYTVNKTSVHFFGKQFTSKNSVLQYIKNNTKVVNDYVEGYNAQWKLSYNGKIETFTNSSDLTKSINDKYITEQLYRTNVDLKQYESADGRVLDQGIWENIFNASSESARVYQGANDVAYNNQKDAYNSFFNVKNAYYFNGIFFNTKESLKDYLITQYLPNSTTNKTNNIVIIQGPNGIKSAPINLDSSNAYNQIGNFIINNAQKVLSYTNSKTGKELTITRNNMNSSLSDINIGDLNYIHVQSNQGQSRYVIDNDYTDDANLIGPYFYNGTLDVGAFTNKKMWKKINGVTNSVYVQSKVDSMIGSFFSSIINDDSSLILSDSQESGKDPVLFRTLLTDDEGNSYDDLFLKQLKKLSPDLAEAVIQANETLLKGKKYNTFNKIPILYSFLMQRALSWGLGQNVVNLIIDYFTNVCNFIQDAIELVVMDDSLLKSKDGKSMFNMVKFFQIGNPEYDLNTSTEYFLNELKTQYPSFIAAMNTYISAQNNIAMMAGLIPYSAIDNSFLIDFKICDLGLLNSIKTKLEIIYNTFSSLDYESEMLPTYIKNSKREDIKEIQTLDKAQWKEAFSKIKGKNSNIDYNTMLSGIGAKNNQYHALVRSMLDLEIKTYLSTGQIVRYGYLEKIYSSDQTRDKLGPFLDLISKNKNLDTYRIYLALLIDKRMNTNIINAQAMANPLNFARALSQVIIFGLGSAALVGNSVNKIFGNNSISVNRIANQASISNATTNSNLSKASISNWWSVAPGEDTSPLSEPLNNPLFKLFNDANENIKTPIQKSKALISINPKDPNVSKQIDLLKNANSFKRANVRTSALIEHFERMSIATMEGLINQPDISKENVKKMVDFFNGLNVKEIDNIPVAANPTDVAKAKLAEQFDGIDGYVEKLTNNASINIDINGGYKSQATIDLENKLNDKKNNKPKRENFTSQKEYEDKLWQWNQEMRKLEAQLNISKIGDSGLLSYPLRKDFATDAEYKKAFNNWLDSYTKFAADLHEIDETKFKLLNQLDDYPMRSDFGSDIEFYKASDEYKAKYDKVLKQVAPEADISWVGGKKPDINNGSGNINGGNNGGIGGDINRPGSGSGNGSNKPGGISGVGETSPETNQKPNLTHPKYEDFLDEDAYLKAYSKWNQNYYDFLNNWFKDLPEHLRKDYLNNIGEYPQFKDYKTEFEFLQACDKWESKYNDWIKTNLPENSHQWGKPGIGGGSSGGTTHPGGGNGSIGGGSGIRPPINGDNGNHHPDIPDGDKHPTRPGVDSEIEANSKKTFKQKLKNWWSGESKFTKIKDTVMTVGSYALEILGTAFAAMEIFFFIYDLLQVNYTQDFYQYTTADGTNFYWDGGLTVSRFMGLDVKQEKGIDSMKLLNPIQITLPQVEEYYYFNGVKYYSTDELKKDELTYIFNGGEFAKTNENFKIKYSFGVDTSSNYNIKADDLDNLIKLVFEELKISKKQDGSIDATTFNKNSSLVSDSALSFGNNIIVGQSDNYQTQAQNIVDNIRGTKIVKLPDTKDITKSNTNFVYPGNYWDETNKKVIYQDATQFKDYLVDNSANDLKTTSSNGWMNKDNYVTPDAKQAEQKSIESLRQIFENSFTLNSKSILQNQQRKAFSQMSGDNFVKPLYKVQLPNSAPQWFVDQVKATNYVLKMLNFKKETDYKQIKKYVFNGIIFNSEAELLNWASKYIVI